jgi:hypothetical protein
MKGAFGIPRGFRSSEKIVFGFEAIAKGWKRALNRQIRLVDEHDGNTRAELKLSPGMALHSNISTR